VLAANTLASQQMQTYTKDETLVGGGDVSPIHETCSSYRLEPETSPDNPRVGNQILNNRYRVHHHEQKKKSKSKHPLPISNSIHFAPMHLS